MVGLIAASGEVNTSHLHPLHLLRELVTAINEEMVKSVSPIETYVQHTHTHTQHTHTHTHTHTQRRSLCVVLVCPEPCYSLQPSLAEKTAWSQKGAVIFGDLMKSMEPGLSGDFPPKAMEYAS